MVGLFQDPFNPLLASMFHRWAPHYSFRKICAFLDESRDDTSDRFIFIIVPVSMNFGPTVFKEVHLGPFCSPWSRYEVWYRMLLARFGRVVGLFFHFIWFFGTSPLEYLVTLFKTDVSYPHRSHGPLCGSGHPHSDGSASLYPACLG